ncbi:protein OSB3, chloroplastic/mitochondrial-like isoform X1 [Juglans microcarpa x Juglans regia]|uniref:protein OSB3, chloroplastic/mitochondrial-like isoform X1 n=1 Tax=Juglans microcarpa x Juglans regia TaxID=2249226 RepID=UPI001B7F3C55|nr:protein OSB3, chloroplastic/mitochondrial-like isoform X1 [Juglans microcarpa x Juglans regia]
MNSLIRFSRAFSKSASSHSTTKGLRFLYPPTLFLQSYAAAAATDTTTTSPKKKYKLQKDNFLGCSTASGKPKPRGKPPPHEVVADSGWARPSEIPFQAKVANLVNLIGYVHIPVQFEASRDGKYWAGTVITQDQASDSPPLWIPIIFEGDLAHIAACHLKEKDCVHVAGQLSADPPHLIENSGQSSIQVMVHSLNFIQGYSQMKRSLAPQEQKRFLQDSASVKDEDEDEDEDEDDINQSWKDLLAKPHEWWDIRLKEENPEGAAFERKSNGELLRIDDSIPEWVQKQLETITFECKAQLKSSKNFNKKVGINAFSAGVKKRVDSELNPWRELLDNPKQWWDFRSSKLTGSVNPKFPDFKCKVGDRALWLDGAPGWVLSELEGVEFDVKNIKLRQNKGDSSWKDLVENPDKWWDNRSNKRNAKSPDFKHKETGDVLWLSNSPGWVLPKLPPLRGKEDKTTGKRDTLLS